jgi:hypothetical protein
VANDKATTTGTLIVGTLPYVGPHANNDSYNTAAGTPLLVAEPGVLSNDVLDTSSTLTVKSITGATGTPTQLTNGSAIASTANGSVTINSNGSFIYTPANGFSGVDTFSYTAIDGNGLTDSALVTVSVAQNPTTTSITSSLNPSTYAQSVTFTSTVTSSGGGVPAVSVEFFDRSTDLGAGSAGATGTNSANWTFTTSTLTAGSHSITAVFTTTGGFSNSMSTALIQWVNKGTAAITVIPYDVTYDGNPHTATGTAIGVGGLILSGLDLSGTMHTKAGAYNDSWTFSDTTGNYNNATGSVTDSIAKANVTVSVTPYSVTYYAVSHTATGSVSAAGAVNQADLDLSGTTHTNAGTYNDTWTFTDTTDNYNNASGTVTDVIDKANARICVTPCNVEYDSRVHCATGTVTGINGQILAGLKLDGTACVNVGTYCGAWYFVDATGNYNNADVAVTNVIQKANAFVIVAPYNVAFNGQAHTSTGVAIGVDGRVLPGLILRATTHIGAYRTRRYRDTWTFNDVTGNYNIASGKVVNIIRAKAALYRALFHPFCPRSPFRGRFSL